MKNNSPVIDVKIEYCRKCGSCLDGNKRCTGCGKQYFHIKKDAWLKFYAFCITLVLIVFVCENNRNSENANAWMNMYYSASKLEPQLEKSEKLCQKLQSRNDQLSEEFNNLQAEKITIQGKLNYYEKNAVFVTANGAKYHKADCYHIYGKSRWIYNVEAAKGRGYTACTDCW